MRAAVAPLRAGRLSARCRRMYNLSRELIYRYIDENPGCTMPEVARDRSINLGSVRYHVNRLEIASRIMLVRAGKEVRLFRNAGAFSRRDIEVISAMKVRKIKAIIVLIRDHPGLSNKQIADGIGANDGQTHRYLSRLIKEHIVRFETEGIHKAYFLESDIGEILRKLLSPQGCGGHGSAA